MRPEEHHDSLEHFAKWPNGDEMNKELEREKIIAFILMSLVAAVGIVFAIIFHA